MSKSFDVVVIGGGPGGYVAAIRAAQLGLKVACVDKRGTLGGTCLNVGCIPSKALLHSTHEYNHAKNGLEPLGIKVDNVSFDLDAIMANKNKTVSELTKGIEFLFTRNKVEYFVGAGRLTGPNSVEVTPAEGDAQTLEARNIIIATGSEVASLPGIEIDEKRVVSSTGALALPKVPKHLVVIGGGYIGLEMGSVWQRLGAEVTVIEFLDRILPGMDSEISKTMTRLLKKQGMKIKTGTKVTGVTTTARTAKVTVEPVNGGGETTISCDMVLVSVGRKPHTEGLGLEEAGVALDDRGRVVTDGNFRTSVPSIHAIGDAIAGAMLAHKASEEGAACAEIIAGHGAQVNYDAIPGVVYTAPEAACVGKTEEQLKEEGVEYTVGKFPLTANSRSKVTGNTDGFVKLLTDAATDRVLGVHIVAADAGNMIAEAVLAMEYGASAEDIALTCHAHPTEMEAMKEAALAAGSGAIHI
ncbi:MAG: dihydrolipoyl dehydrogenase [Sphingomonadales bacterium]